MKLTSEILAEINLDNWEEIYDKLLVIEGEGYQEFVFNPEEMKEFIRELLAEIIVKHTSYQHECE